jgi:DNA-binding response OmpR family regulator
MRILVVEDEHHIAQALKKGLEQEAYAVDLAFDGVAGYDLGSTEEYDIILLDLMLPKMDGSAVCANLRKEGIQTPILMLTAKDQIMDKVEGLDAGADDYLAKPFAFDELLARIRALLRRPREVADTILAVGNVVMDVRKKEVKVDNRRIMISAKEYALLEYFLRHANQIVSKQQLIEHVWDYDADILPNTVEVYVKKLREKDIQIQTIRGFGYRLE